MVSVGYRWPSQGNSHESWALVCVCVCVSVCFCESTRSNVGAFCYAFVVHFHRSHHSHHSLWHGILSISIPVNWPIASFDHSSNEQAYRRFSSHLLQLSYASFGNRPHLIVAGGFSDTPHRTDAEKQVKNRRQIDLTKYSTFTNHRLWFTSQKSRVDRWPRKWNRRVSRLVSKRVFLLQTGLLCIAFRVHIKYADAARACQRTHWVWVEQQPT